ncbi:MAG: glutamate racemase [Verrucomicrobiales bacterium]
MTNASNRKGRVRAAAPIGVFDSGVGGLSVLREIRSSLPNEDLIYVADSAHVPYGSKRPQDIIDRSRVLSRFLLDRGCKALVIACNTATASAAAMLRQEFPHLLIIGMEPAVKPAAAATKNGVVGVLATVGTIRSARFAALLDRFAHDIKVVTQPAPGLVEQVEAGKLDSLETRELIDVFVRPLRRAGADTIVLGCTHFPFLKPLIAEAAGNGVTLVDTGAAVARQLKRRLAEAALLRPVGPGEEQFWTSGDQARVRKVVGRLWGGEPLVQLLS